LVPQVVAPWSVQTWAGSGDPVGTLVQVPSEPESAQDLQAPLQAVAQQIPCAHIADAHSVLPEHEAPLGFLPQELATQTLPALQFPSTVQPVKHLVPLHTYGMQFWAVGATQAPVASHIDGPVYAPEVQRSGAQTVPARYLRHAPAPSQVPSVPQEAAPWSTQLRRGSWAPAATGVQCPSVDVRAQLRQAPWQAVSQQTPSTQKPLPQSLLATHDWPRLLGPQLPFTHEWPATQSASLAHRPRQAPPLQWKGEQACTPGGRQVPTPSQAPAVSTWSPLQTGARQTASAA
jgi:hypothetical protein